MWVIIVWMNRSWGLLSSYDEWVDVQQPVVPKPPVILKDPVMVTVPNTLFLSMEVKCKSVYMSKCNVSGACNLAMIMNTGDGSWIMMIAWGQTRKYINYNSLADMRNEVLHVTARRLHFLMPHNIEVNQNHLHYFLIKNIYNWKIYDLYSCQTRKIKWFNIFFNLTVESMINFFTKELFIEIALENYIYGVKLLLLFL